MGIWFDDRFCHMWILQLEYGGGVGSRQETNDIGAVGSAVMLQEAGQKERDFLSEEILSPVRRGSSWHNGTKGRWWGCWGNQRSQHLSALEPVFLVEVECIIQKLKLNNKKVNIISSSSFRLVDSYLFIYTFLVLYLFCFVFFFFAKRLEQKKTDDVPVCFRVEVDITARALFFLFFLFDKKSQQIYVNVIIVQNGGGKKKAFKTNRGLKSDERCALIPFLIYYYRVRVLYFSDLVT